VTPCSLVDGYQGFGGTICLHLQDWAIYNYFRSLIVQHSSKHLPRCKDSFLLHLVETECQFPEFLHLTMTQVMDPISFLLIKRGSWFSHSSRGPLDGLPRLASGILPLVVILSCIKDSTRLCLNLLWVKGHLLDHSWTHTYSMYELTILASSSQKNIVLYYCFILLIHWSEAIH
jgi:hypothetical protein